MSIDIDNQLLQKAKALGGHDTDESAVHAALVEYVNARWRPHIIDLFGKIDYDPDYDYVAERRAR
jgi:hypothetical protein